MTDIKLGNGEEISRKHSTFQIPHASDRGALYVGDMAKLLFLAPDPGPGDIVGEFMWARVARVVSRNPSRYAGTLANQPTVVHLNLGDPVEFGPEHVIDIIRPDA